MPDDMIRVQFDKHGFYHPAFGRLGRTKNAGTIYSLPLLFAEKETIEVEIHSAPKAGGAPTGKFREVIRYKHLPRTCKIIDDPTLEDMKEEAFENGDEPPAIVRPRVLNPENLPKAAKAKTTSRSSAPQPPATEAVERTTGRRAAGRRRPADPAE